MSELQDLDLTFPWLAYGSHETPYNLKILLYRGGAKAPRHKVLSMISTGKLGLLLSDRTSIVIKLYDVLLASGVKGFSQNTINNRIRTLRTFYAWCDEANIETTEESIVDNYKLWVESLIHRSRVKHEIKENTAYVLASQCSYLISSALNIHTGILNKTRIRAPIDKRSVLGTKADKESLELTFEFGRILLAISTTLSPETITGPLPIQICVDNGVSWLEWCKLRPNELINAMQPGANKFERIQALSKRVACDALTAVQTRSSIFNLKIETELLIFISQTGMNLTQATRLKRGEFRYQIDNGNISVFRVYKGRRHGEAEFQIFKEYGALFKKYISWLDALIDPEDERLFPFVHNVKIKSCSKSSIFTALKQRCFNLNVQFFGPRSLRKSRINWLLRKSRDPALTAEMAQHTQQTLLRVYEQPHHQVAALEIAKFHRLTDPSLAAPGSGMCVETHHPRQIIDAPEGCPVPDCINPGGCLFCESHRDIDTEEYVWSLATYQYCKFLELDQYRPSDIKEHIQPHPASLVIDRIAAKLKAFEVSDDTRAAWVVEAKNRIREARFHPDLEGLIKLMEPNP